VDNLKADLTAIAQLCAQVKPEIAEGKMRALVAALSPNTLVRAEGEIREAIESNFLPKRRRRLAELLDHKLADSATEFGELANPSIESLAIAEPDPRSVPLARPEDTRELVRSVPGNHIASLNVNERLTEFRDVLHDLSEHHIFQWSTFYRDWLAEDFEWFLDAMSSDPRYPELLEGIKAALAAHSYEIFQKGYRYQIGQGETKQYTLAKSLSGLQRFLDLPIEFYSAKLPSAALSGEARRLRALTSALLAAVLSGYAEMDFGGQLGGGVLVQHPGSWAHVLAFLSARDLESVLSDLGGSDFARAIAVNVVPMVEAFDQLGDARVHVPLPAVAQFRRDVGRLSVWLRPSPLSPFPQMIETECYLGESFVHRVGLTEAFSRGVAVVVAPIRLDLRNIIRHDGRLRSMVVDTRNDLADIPETRQNVEVLLAARAYRQGTFSASRQPLQYNSARAFPLENPDLLRHFIVNRRSVRDLLRSFEGRSGIRLWCSVRRSGKTTAGARLDATNSQTAVVTQTCATTGETPNDSIFYDSVMGALGQESQLSPAFLADLVQRCVDGQETPGRFVFVLDEYETLFGSLRAVLRRDPDLRYLVVQPLLNQMVRFARENLIIFLGQQPNAHFILMDQNQLSPYVRQDAFPLFMHDAGDPHEEFAELIGKILLRPIEPTVTFIDAVFGETAGHPFLTVNMLATFVDWLIEQKRSRSNLSLTKADFEEFATAGLMPGQVSMGRDYTFFREAASQAMGDLGRVETPWLHAVYRSMSEMVRASPQTLRCTHDEFREISLRAQGADRIDSDRLLLTGAESNFFAYDDHYVWPKIKLLGRIAAVSEGAIHA
jgi:hypothetical protein